MKHIKETYEELRNRAAAAFWEARHYSQYDNDFLAFRARGQYYAYSIAALKLQNAMFRERCRAKAVHVPDTSAGLVAKIIEKRS